VLVGGKIAESKGILKHWTEANRDEALGLNNWALHCSNGHDYLATSQDELCKECGQPPQDTGQALMFPRLATPLRRGSHPNRQVAIWIGLARWCSPRLAVYS